MAQRRHAPPPRLGRRRPRGPFPHLASDVRARLRDRVAAPPDPEGPVLPRVGARRSRVFVVDERVVRLLHDAELAQGRARLQTGRVGVQLTGAAPVRLLDVGDGGTPGQAQRGIRIGLFHAVRVSEIRTSSVSGEKASVNGPVEDDSSARSEGMTDAHCAVTLWRLTN